MTIEAKIVADSISPDGVRLTTMQLNELFDYDPLTGVLTNKKSRRGVSAGSTAGCVKGDGYVHLIIFGVEYYAHRIIWQMVHGPQMPDMVDHKNGIRNDNRLKNLRAATPIQNAANSGPRIDNQSGIKGVRKHGHKWRAAITISGKSKHLGCFDTPKEASQAYLAAATQQHGSFARA